MIEIKTCCIQEEDDYDVMQDPEFLQSVLENLPGVDPNNEAIRNAMGSLASQTGTKPDGKKDEEKKKWGNAYTDYWGRVGKKQLQTNSGLLKYMKVWKNCSCYV